jgi:hypothetical protein
MLCQQTLDPDPGSGNRIRNKKKRWIRIRIWIRIKSMRIRNPANSAKIYSELCFCLPR